MRNLCIICKEYYQEKFISTNWSTIFSFENLPHYVRPTVEGVGWQWWGPSHTLTHSNNNTSTHRAHTHTPSRFASSIIYWKLIWSHTKKSTGEQPLVVSGRRAAAAEMVDASLLLCGTPTQQQQQQQQQHVGGGRLFERKETGNVNIYACSSLELDAQGLMVTFSFFFFFLGVLSRW